MRVEIDQSGKIEQTNKDTVLAFVNDTEFSIRIPAKVKKQMQKIFRETGKPRLFVYKTFAAGVFILLKHHLSKIKDIVIDEEYKGHEKLITEILVELIEKHNLPQPYIYFQQIGAKPKVHYAAHDVFTRKKKPDYVVSTEDITDLLIQNDRGSEST